MKRTALTTACITGAAAILGLAGQEEAVADPSYTYAEGSYLYIDIDDTGADGDGFGLAGSVALTDMFHLFGDYASADLDGPAGGDLDFETWQVGGGINFSLADNLDLVGRVSYLNAEVDFPGPGSADDDGFGLYGGLRAKLGVPVELEGGIQYADLDDAGDDTSLVLGGRYYFNPRVALGLSADIGDDVTVWGVNLRLEMPN